MYECVEQGEGIIGPSGPKGSKGDTGKTGLKVCKVLKFIFIKHYCFGAIPMPALPEYNFFLYTCTHLRCNYCKWFCCHCFHQNLGWSRCAGKAGTVCEYIEYLLFSKRKLFKFARAYSKFLQIHNFRKYENNTK